MIYEVVNIWEDFIYNEKSAVLMNVYVPTNSPEINPNCKRKTVLICPGGGYRITSDREAEPVALALVGQGFNVLFCVILLHLSATQPSFWRYQEQFG